MLHEARGEEAVSETFSQSSRQCSPEHESSPHQSFVSGLESWTSCVAGEPADCLGFEAWKRDAAGCPNLKKSTVRKNVVGSEIQ